MFGRYGDEAMSVITATMARTRRNLEGAEISAAMFAKLAGVPQSTLKEALQGLHYFGAEKEAELLTLSVRVAEIVESLKPLMFGKGDVESLRTLLDSQIEPLQVREMVSRVFGREGV